MRRTDSVSDRARALVEAALPGMPSVGALAEALGIERTTLFRQLRAEGTTPSALIQEVRLGWATRLLRRGVPVGEVAHAVGYSEVSAFSRAFRQHHGVAPSAWATGEGPGPP